MTEVLHWISLQAPFVFLALSWYGPGWCCPPPRLDTTECNQCTDEEKLTEYAIEITGITNNTCTGCADLNGTWVMADPIQACLFQRNIASDTPNLQWLFGSTCFSASTVGPVSMSLAFRSFSEHPTGGGRTIFVQATWGSSGSFEHSVVFEKTYGSDLIPCRSLASVDVPRVFGQGGACDTTGAACEISGL